MPPLVLESVDYFNDSEIQQSFTIGHKKTTTATVQTTVTAGISSQVSTSAKLTSPGVELNSGSQLTITFSIQQQQTESGTQEWDCTLPVLIPARSGIRATWKVSMSQYRVPFAGEVSHYGIIRVACYENMLAPKYSEIPIGRFFKKVPDPHVTVIDDDEVAVKVSGFSEVTQGTNLRVALVEYKKQANEPEEILRESSWFQRRPDQFSQLLK